MLTASITLLALAQTHLFPSPSTFPIAVWLQSPANAPAYQRAGFNLYIGLWQGPKEEDLATLKRYSMPVICDQNAVGLAHLKDRTIVGWLQQDEPDNAQPSGTGYGPCVPPSNVVSTYKKFKTNDPSRPVLLNLGQGVANDEWIGRGSGAKLSDYEEYVHGGDIVSFDIYPVAGIPKPNSEEFLPLVAKGVDRLSQWAGGAKPRWNCIECTGIDSGKKATPSQVRAEVRMSLIHGSTGLVYFVHEFKPKFKEAALLDDPEMLEAVTKINAQVQGLGDVLLHGQPIKEMVGIHDTNNWIDVRALRFEGKDYLLTVNMRNRPAMATFDLGSQFGKGSPIVLGEGRRMMILRRHLTDRYEPYGVHLYCFEHSKS